MFSLRRSRIDVFVQKQFLLLLLLVFVILRIAPPSIFLVYFSLAFWALQGPRQTIEAFSIMFLILLGNPAIVPVGGRSLRYLVFFAGFSRMLLDFFMDKNRSNNSSSVSTLLLTSFSILLIPVSLYASKIAAISFLKLFAFSSGALTILYSNRATKTQKEYWITWYSNIFMFIIFVSLVILPLGLGYERNGRGFQGIFNHPQVMGSIAAIIGSWFAGFYFTTTKHKSISAFMAIISILFIFLSGARTGLVSLGGGLLIAVILYWVKRKRIPHFNQLAFLGFLFIILLIGVALFFPSKINSTVSDFVQKRTTEANLTEVFQESRGFLIDKSLENFSHFPVFGIGLGVPSDYQEGTFGTTETFMGIPVSATVEKGFLPSAILEEMGLFGAFFTLAFVLTLLNRVLNHAHFIFLWIITTSLLINIGEAVLFSVGGKGLMVWLIIGFSLSISSIPNSGKKNLLPLSKVRKID